MNGFGAPELGQKLSMRFHHGLCLTQPGLTQRVYETDKSKELLSEL